MRDGIHRTSPQEILLVRDGRVVRRVTSASDGDAHEVTVSRTLGAESQEDRDGLLEYHGGQLEEDWDGVTRCSFCEKRREEVPTLIAGPTSYICSECVTLCREMLE